MSDHGEDAQARAESILRRVKDARLTLELEGGVEEPDLTRDLQWCAEQLLAALARRSPPPQAQQGEEQEAAAIIMDALARSKAPAPAGAAPQVQAEEPTRWWLRTPDGQIVEPPSPAPAGAAPQAPADLPWALAVVSKFPPFDAGVSDAAKLAWFDAFARFLDSALPTCAPSTGGAAQAQEHVSRTCPTCDGKGMVWADDGLLAQREANDSFGPEAKTEAPAGAAGLREAVFTIQSVAAEAWKHWDADEDSKVGKMLGALAGRKGYRLDLDAAFAALVSPADGGTGGAR